jgi:ribulose-5-phosphate 4-epimerase/fuculose-1-phosphate aldolase
VKVIDSAHHDAVHELIDFGAAVAEAGLAESTAGNVSLRLDSGTMLISASGAELGALGHDRVAAVALADGVVVEGPAPSLECDLHRRIYASRASAGAVLHGQSPAATLLACRPEPPASLDFIPEIPAYVRGHAYVPYAPPGTKQLAESVACAFDDDEVTVVQMRNHGQVVIGSSWRKAVRRAVFFEMACWMAAQDSALRTIPPEEVARLRSFARDL